MRKSLIISLLMTYLPASATTPSHLGAQKIFATMFQSCDANNVAPISIESYEELKEVVERSKPGRYWKRFLRSENKELYQDNHQYLQLIKNTEVSNECVNVLDRPSVYAYGGTPVVKNGELILLEDLTTQYTCKNDPGNGSICRRSETQKEDFSAVTGMDCSAFISAAYAASGLKFKTSQKSPYNRYTTTGIHQMIHGSKSRRCLSAPRFYVDKPLLPGDIINIKASHVVMVDQVGNDPLAIESVKKIENCDNITADQFDFSIYQSSSLKNIGMNRINANAYFPIAGSTFRSNLERIATKLCQAKFEKKEYITFKNSSNNRFSFSRHLGPDKKSCIGKKIQIKEQGCINECF